MNLKKTGWGIAAGIAALGLAASLTGLWITRHPGPDPEVLPPVSSETSDGQAETSEENAVKPETVEAPEEYEKMRQENKDIHAWIQVPGTSIDYPVVQHPEDDTYYIRRDTDGNYSVAGSIFTEHHYNQADFSDPVTLLYGHQMPNGTMFGSLQPYMTSHSLGEGDLIYIYRPDFRKTYQIFAAVPYDSSHVLYYHDFSDPAVYEAFFDQILNTHSLYANVNPQAKPEFPESVVILSTCMEGDNTSRFLVIGAEIAENPIA